MRIKEMLMFSDIYFVFHKCELSSSALHLTSVSYRNFKTVGGIERKMKKPKLPNF